MEEQEHPWNYYEYNYDQKVEGKYKRNRILYIIGATLVSIALTASCCITDFKLLLWCTPVVFMFCVYGSRFFFRYFQNEYSYIIDRNVFTMNLIHGKAKPVLMYKVDIKEAEAIVKYNAKTAEAYPESAFDKIYRSCITKEEGDLYMLIFTDENGKRCLGYFEAGKKALKIMKFYNEKTELCDTLRH